MNEIDYLRQACQTAAARSPDLVTQNAAVLVSGQSVVCGVNAFPIGVRATFVRRNAPFKYLYTEHAERAAIYRAAALGVPTAGSTLYCPWFACTDCARAIILSGVKEVVGLIVTRNATPARWLENIEIASEMLAEAGVGQRLLSEKMGITIRFDGGALEC